MQVSPQVDVQTLQEESKTAILLPSEEERENGQENEEGGEDPPIELLDDHANNQAGNTDWSKNYLYMWFTIVYYVQHIYIVLG